MAVPVSSPSRKSGIKQIVSQVLGCLQS
jgi:hypothetical protein